MMNATNGSRYHTARVSPYMLAGCVPLVAALISGLLNSIPFRSIEPISVNVDISILAFVVLPFLLSLSVITRATAQTPTELVLGLLVIPCLPVGIWALYEHFIAQPGVYWRRILTTPVGSILALAVLIDATIEHLM